MTKKPQSTNPNQGNTPTPASVHKDRPEDGEDEVTMNSIESMDASDPPSWTSTTGTAAADAARAEKLAKEQKKDHPLK